MAPLGGHPNQVTMRKVKILEYNINTSCYKNFVVEFQNKNENLKKLIFTFWGVKKWLRFNGKQHFPVFNKFYLYCISFYFINIFFLIYNSSLLPPYIA